MGDRRPLLERDQIRFRLAMQLDHSEGGNVEAERLVVEHRGEALDDAGLLERPHPAQARWRGDTDLTGEIHIGDPPVGLKLAQDQPIRGIETRCTHGS